ncbi:interferon-induced GTP-binding protein Mx [Lentithecium fluviatile CBS 122367]|uniref:Interferon-induced GTP-binding protein Mx n=1 Tax=Lentithecium fluviatile CBS 122367 TaxID=1168545 RepID=A0A6G1IN98_9PLEO|nr:interferon-induced GTP-binding protein Mx [Lentithecium fluviatile CBS 122367]
MAGPARSSYRKPPVRSLPASSPGDGQPSSGTTLVDEHMNVVDGDNIAYASNGTNGYVTPKTERSSTLARTDMSRLSQECESLNLNLENAHVPHVLGKHQKEVISVISKLEGLGLQRLNIPLPKCVVLGEQSTGKSSVIEAISGIRTPRATDTCTRCPLFIKLEPSSDPLDQWRAQVIIRQSYAYDGGRRQKFPGWKANPTPTNVPFAETDSPKVLEELIARAQLAALSPLNDPMEFLHPAALSRDPNTFHRTEFSPNIVCIHISQPESPALSFYDLPGIIGQSESAENQYLVKFVRDLVSEYIKDPDSLILVTCSLENDIANSTAGGFARELKATDRCIGVLTKPDRLPPGSREDRLQAVLDGKSFRLGHGYYVVKNPGQDDIDLGLSHSAARLCEQEFFTTNTPWATTLRNYHVKFGTLNLQSFLSEKLTEQMMTMLPVIREQVNTRLEQVETNLKDIPEPPTHNATRIVSDILLSFSNHVRQEMKAEYPCRSWRNSWESLHKEFLKGLVSMKPTMITTGKLDEGIFAAATPGRSVHDYILIDSEDEGEDTPMSESPETPSRKRKIDLAGSPMPPSPPRSMKPLNSRNQTPSRGTPSRTMDMKPNLPVATDYSKLRSIFQLDRVSLLLKEKSKSRLPDQLDPKVVDDLIIDTLQEWQRPLRKFLEDLERELKEAVKVIFIQHFGQWKGSALWRNAWKIVNEILDINFTEQRTTIAAESLNDELDGPYVFNEDVFARERLNTLEQYRRARYRARVMTYAREMQDSTGRTFTPQEREKLSKDEKKQAIITSEPYEKEVAVVSRVTTYYMLAARRFYESVCIRIESKFFKRLHTSLRDDLDSGLGIHDHETGPQNAIDLLAEPSDRLIQRKELVARKKALIQGLGWLQDLEARYGDGIGPSCQTANGDVNDYRFSSFGPTSTPLAEDMEDITRSRMAGR